MSKYRLRLGIFVTAVVVGAIILTSAGILLARGTFTQSSKVTTSTPPATATVIIPQTQEVFTPFVVALQSNTSVTWENKDTVAHTFGTTWDHSTFLNPQAFAFTVAAGQSATFTFAKPGLYHYFDNTQATWDGTNHRVRANKGVPNFPLAMEGIIWVQGSISGLPSSGTNLIPEGKDHFSIEFLAITQGGTISWHNQDTDAHNIASVVGWSAPINPTDLGSIEVKGTEGVPNGETKTLTFNQPGLFYYYCTIHSSVNSTWHRAQAFTHASLFPIPMEGFILVVG